MAGSHFATDLHRYNAKRRVAGLPPISADVFNAKVLEKRSAVGGPNDSTQSDGLKCIPCGKSFASENSKIAHEKSKKHKEIAVRALAKSLAPKPVTTATDVQTDNLAVEPQDATMQASNESEHTTAATPASTSTAIEADPNDEAAIKKLVDQRLANAVKIPQLECLFCPRNFLLWSTKISHMHRSHGFFIPDREYLTDEEGLVNHVAELMSVWNACIVCNLSFGGKAALDGQPVNAEKEALRSKRGLEAVRKHMCDKVGFLVDYLTQL